MLSKTAKKELRAMGQNLNSMIQIGKGGITPAFYAKLDEELEAHELVKLSALKTADIDMKEAARELAENTNSELIQQIGKTAVLYRRSKENKLGIRP